MTTTVLNTKISEVENKILDNFKHITTQKFNKFTARLKQADLVNKTDFDNKLTRFTGRITSNKAKHLEAQKKLNSVITKDYNFFLGRICFTSNDRSQNTFFYQPTLDALELKKDKGSDYLLSWISNRVFNSKLKSLCTTFLNNIKLPEYRIGIKFDKDSLALEQNNYLTKIVNVYKGTDYVLSWKSNDVFNSKLKSLYSDFLNSIKLSGYRIGIKFDKDPLALEQNVYIVYDLDAWTRNPTNNFKFKNCLFGASNTVNNSDKEKYVYTGYGITFDSADSWSFDNGFARNVIIFGVDNS